MADDGDKLTPKEHAKLQRRKAYLAAKEKRKSDPRHIALQEKLKQQRRDAYQKQKAYLADKKSMKKNADRLDKVLQKQKEEELIQENKSSELSASEKIRELNKQLAAKNLPKLSVIQGGKE